MEILRHHDLVKLRADVRGALRYSREVGARAVAQRLEFFGSDLTGVKTLPLRRKLSSVGFDEAQGTLPALHRRQGALGRLSGELGDVVEPVARVRQAVDGLLD